MNYNMETLSREQLVELIKNGDDSYDNQIRVTKDGIIFLSRIVGAEDISNLRFRFETYDAGNGYVGPEAADDDEYIDDLYNGLIKTWKFNRTGYVDDWKL
ncbi:MAG: hypothetical protein E6845_18555 [Clostridium sp.]|uniref:hypothetical protein n=1 Tax=Clostridium sp. TaxID=1506 RepID=UPI00290206CD|nr:hypothetical protein [Clostridium sp.]MDU1604960.1 hypothetical protein [Clostridium sp.]